MKKGFTLVELSIVLVILGLLVGGVLAGQSLIRAAELRSVTSDSARLLSTIHTFRDKYFSIPGDMPNATAFWGIAGGTGSDATCASTVSTDARTCNGDGSGNFTNASGMNGEAFRFWQHVANAGLIEGRYTGANATLSGSPYAYTAGINTPASKLDSTARWLPLYLVSSTGNAGNFIYPLGGGIGLSTLSGLKPEEAWNIDTKMDDGMPSTGKILPFKGTTGNCTTATNVAPPGDAGATYVLSNQNKDCPTLYWMGAF